MWILRLFAILMVVLTALYLIVSIWSRRVRRAKLEARWDEEGREGDRAAFVRAGLKEYDGSLRRKLILGIYIVPLAAIAAIVYVVNYM